MVKVRQAVERDGDVLIQMALALWPESEPREHSERIHHILSARRLGPLPAELFVGEVDGQIAGFLEASLRSRADGCDPRYPVGYLEGWYVKPEFRRSGVGKALLALAEAWSREQGCREIDSDTWVEREESQCAHEKLGFQVVDCCVNFRKEL